MEMKYYQKTTHLLLRKKPFMRLVGENYIRYYSSIVLLDAELAKEHSAY